MSVPWRYMQELLRSSAKIISAEAMLPRSPGAVLNGRTVLCAGAQVVYQAAIRSMPPDGLTKLSENILRGGKSSILDYARQLRLDASLVESLINLAERIDDVNRGTRMAHVLNALAEQPTPTDLRQLELT